MAHKVSNMFKCPMCQFEHKDDNPNIFEEHYKLQHPSVAVKCLRVFEKVSVDFWLFYLVHNAWNQLDQIFLNSRCT